MIQFLYKTATAGVWYKNYNTFLVDLSVLDLGVFWDSGRWLCVGVRACRCLLNLLSAILSAHTAKGIPTLDLLSPEKSDTEEVRRERRDRNG